MEFNRGVRNNKGNLLATVLCVMFVLATLAMALHWQQARSRAVYMREEAAIQARQSAEFAMTDRFTTDPLSPPNLQVKVSPENYPAPAPSPNVGSKLFTGMPALNESSPVVWDSAMKAYPGAQWTELNPTTLNPALDTARRRYIGVSSESNPYGALAPSGAVHLESAAGWSNPTFPETVGHDARVMFSAVPVRVGAGNGVTVKKLHYGEIYLKDGNVDVDSGNVVAYRGALPNNHRLGKDYFEAFEQELNTAFTDLTSVGQNKTANIEGDISFGAIWDLITGSKSFEQALGGALSLRQSLEFPFPVIPGGNELGIVTNIWVHMPYPPDTAPGGDSDELAKDADKLKEITDKMAETQKKIEELEAKIPTISDPDEKQDAINQLNALKESLEDLAEDAEDIGEANADKMQGHIATSNPDDDGPDTRDDEGSLGEDGQMGWAYGAVFKKILHIFGKVFSGDFKGLAEELAHKARVVHFGPSDNKTKFNITPGNFEMEATLNVPPGRTLRYDGNMTVHGDLWVQKGASLTVNGNLTLVSPLLAPSDDLLTPQGRLCLEEGATVLVQGDFTCAGSPQAGSVLVAGPVNQVHNTTSALIVKRNVTIPYGVYPAMTLDGLGGVVPALADASHVLTTVTSNLSKVAGPFHRRKPYFARYATTFQIVKWPYPPMVIPLCVPLPTPKNVLNPMFSAVGTIYQVQLNLVLGENFTTYTDWWFLGKGVVPMLPKVDPAALAGLQSLSLPTSLPSGDEVLNYLKDYGLKAGKEMATQLITKVVQSLIQSQMGFPMSLVGDFAGDAVNKLTEWVTEALDAQKLGGSGDKMSALSGIADQIESLLNGSQVKPLLAECTGVLIYAGQDLRVNSSGLQVPVAVGYLVANGNVACNTEYLVGAACSKTGSITAKNLLYVPEMTRVSLYRPKSSPTVDTGLSWLNWALEPQYGKDFDSQQSVQIGPGRPHMLTDSWDR